MQKSKKKKKKKRETSYQSVRKSLKKKKGKEILSLVEAKQTLDESGKLKMFWALMDFNLFSGSQRNPMCSRITKEKISWAIGNYEKFLTFLW